MATDPQSVYSGRPHGCPDERWQRMWSHREHLLRVARRRSMSVEDAEDAVHEAMVRALENPHVEDERLGAWLTTVTMRLCVDRYRQVKREAEVGTRSMLTPHPIAPVDEAVCDRAEAKWLANRSGELPARQAEALWLKSEDLDVGQVARKMGLSYRTVESLLARARRTMRNSLGATLATGFWICWRGRPRLASGAQVVTVASTAATLAVLGFALPSIYTEEMEEDGVRSPASSQTVADSPTGAEGHHRTDVPGLMAGSESRGPAAWGPAGPLAGAGLLLLDVSLPLPPPTELAVPATPSVHRMLSVLDVQGVPDAPDVPEAPAVPGLSSAASAPLTAPSAPATPSAPAARATPSAPATPSVPGNSAEDAEDDVPIATPRDTPSDTPGELPRAPRAQ
ncbi:RNA polymerase sigma factor [Streptomyces chattanoogensis]|uniref:RNA polymerase sigma factor n=1 Tax=Streptomyces chattanoogensis TaxID=66876 RepID=UPI00099CC217|nr:sigma-70 family RNA polymerase sigma factor [Streptomyces chattanoogensis]